MQTNGARIVQSLCFLLMLGTVSVVYAQNAVVPGSSLKAAYLYHFIQFTEWPSSLIADLKTFGVCIVGESQLEPALINMNGKIAHGKPIELHVYDLNQKARCQVVIFNAGDQGLLERQSTDLMALNVLTVSQNPEMVLKGAIITLVFVDDRIGFFIDKTLAKSSGLDISSKLLRLARSVK